MADDRPRAPCPQFLKYPRPCAWLLASVAFPGVAWAQSAGAGAERLHQPKAADIVVTGRRPGSADEAPERELDAKEIDSYSADTIGDLLKRFAPFIDGSDDQPGLLINGKHITNPAEITGFPPEALERVEVLPADAALRYGEASGKRIVNLVLRKKFAMTTANARTEAPTAGGRTSNSFGIQDSRVANDTRFALNAKMSLDSPLLASERGLENEADPRGARTMLPKASNVGLNATFAGPIAGWELSSAVSTSLARQQQVDGALNRSVQTNEGFQLSVRASRTLGRWSANLGIDAQINGSSVRLQSATPTGSFDSQATSKSANLHADVGRSIPFSAAGPLQLNASGSFSLNWFRNSDIGADASPDGSTATSQRQWASQVGLTLPLSKREGRSLPGDVDLMGRVGATGASSGHALMSFDGAVNWSPIPRLQMIGQLGLSAMQPTTDQLSGPIVETANFPIYDFATAAMAGVTRVTGGNSALKSGLKRALSVSVSVGPFGKFGFFPNIIYEASTSSNAVGRFPWFSPAIEAAYPERITRDAAGNLVRIDSRPINIDGDRDASLKAMLRFAIPLGWLLRRPPSSEVLQVNLSQSWHLTSQTSFRPGVPRFDRLKGDAGGVFTSDTSVNLQSRIGPINAAMTARWRGLSRIRMNVGADGPGDLIFDGASTVDIRLSYSIGDRRQNQKSRSVLWGVRASLEVENLFGTYQRAHLGDGRQAEGYRRYDQDALGRVVSLSLSRPI